MIAKKSLLLFRRNQLPHKAMALVTPFPGEFTFLAVKREGTSIKVFLDDVVVATGSITDEQISIDSDNRIGLSHFNSNELFGELKKISAYNYALSDIDVFKVRNDGVDIYTGLKSWHKFDNNGLDSSGNDFDATLLNTPTFVSPGHKGTHHINFVPASDQHGTIPYNWSTINSSFTLAVWARENIISGHRTLLGAVGSSPLWWSTGAGRIAFAVGGFTEGVTQLASPLVNTVGVWYHHAVTWDGTTLILYRNGVEAIRDSSMSLTWIDSLIWFAKRQTHSHWDGDMDDLRIYTPTVLTPEQIAYLASL